MDEFQLFQVMEAAAHHCQSYTHGLRDTISKNTKDFDRRTQSTLIDRWLKQATTPVTPEGWGSLKLDSQHSSDSTAAGFRFQVSAELRTL